VDDTARGVRLDVWLAARGLPYSRSQLGRRIDEGEVTVDGRRVKSAHRVRAGERVVFTPPALVPTEDLPEDIPLAVLFEDRHLIVIDKPPGLVVHPASSHEGGTLVNALLHHCGDSLVGVGGERRPGIVHRLDKDTSGVMVVAKDEPTLVALQALFHDHDLERQYLAIVDGVVPEQGTIRTQYGRHPRDRKKYSSKVTGGRHAVTHWRVKERLKGATLIEVTLETGRTHQIRVHFADRGHPVLGDPVYGRAPRDSRVRKLAAELGRQALHAQLLGIVHPHTREKLAFRTDPPQDFRRMLEELRK
jgi:23S rRNA pseudouridine1911/1915/1917 synthase